MKKHIAIRPITANESRPLRHAILRPHEPIQALVARDQRAPSTVHFGAFMQGELVGCASVAREPLPDEDNARAWRLRGMATAEIARRLGCGRALVDACIAHVIANGGILIWCNGRTSVIGFYRALGFETRGDEFESTEGTGPHYVFVRQL